MSLTIERNQTVIWTKKNVPHSLNVLRMETNSKIILQVDVKIICKEFIVGDHVQIIGVGEFGSNGKSYRGSKPRRKSGYRSGANGRNGGKGLIGKRGFHFQLSAEVFEFGRLTINTSGGNGGNGGNGEGGGKGSNASCPEKHGLAGGIGGKGGDGARGGDAGRVIISFNEYRPRGTAELNDIKWYPNGGYGGRGGKGGKGGTGGNSGQCGLNSLDSGSRGKKGEKGDNGKNGNTIVATRPDFLIYHGTNP